MKYFARFAELDSARKSLARFNGLRTKIEAARRGHEILQFPGQFAAAATPPDEQGHRVAEPQRQSIDDSILARFVRALRINSTAELSFARILTVRPQQRASIATDYSSLQNHVALGDALSADRAIKRTFSNITIIRHAAALIGQVATPDAQLSSRTIADAASIVSRAGIRETGTPGADVSARVSMPRLEVPRFVDFQPRPESTTSAASLAPITLNSSPTVVVHGGGASGVDIERRITAALNAHREEIFNQMKHERAMRERMEF